MIRPSRAAFAFIFITVTLDMLALGIIVPVLPKLIVAFEGGDVAHAARIVGVFGFAWSAMQFLAGGGRSYCCRTSASGLTIS
jgi:MFS transporter, DHA1 family, tetracycline resistance protein